MKMVTLSEKARQLEARKRAVGFDDACLERARNNGRKRTPAKRALLRAIADEARRQGRKVPFAAHF